MSTGTPLLAYNVWLALPTNTRNKLTKLFGIPRTGEVIVRSGGMYNGNIGGEMIQDGHSAKDLYAISVEKMQTLLKTDDTDFYKMFHHIVENIDFIIEPQIEEEIAEPTIDPKEKAKFHSLMTPKKRGRPAKIKHETKE